MLAYRAPADHFAPQASSSRVPSQSRSTYQQPPAAATRYDPPPLAKAAPTVPFPSSARLPVAPPAPPAQPTTTAQQQPIGKTDKGKLTEQWGAPPDQIKRDDEWLERGKLLGEGGFARVYLATEQTGQLKALKVVAKEQLKSSKNKGKLFAEIKIHQAMKHDNIICFEHCFEDERNVYMQLELCANGSMLDLLRRRKRYSEPEARFYIVQLIGACEYMHDNSVIHRDLKLGNLMLDADMNLRVGDFGLAALVKFPGERKKTICGTPNYIAPEILFDTTNGHSFEVDIWSIGVILYTLLVGKPPFQMKDVKNIYRKIKDNNYEFPPGVELSAEAINLIESILTTQPDQRPTLADILKHNFFTTGPFPPAIPASAIHYAPDFRQMSIRRSHANFEMVKKQCGIVEVEEEQQPARSVLVPSRSQPLAAVAEEEEGDARAPAAVAVPPARRPISAQAKEMDREVARAIEPDSPVSELLKSARKPLVVSPPRVEPRDVVQRNMVADARQRTNSANGTAIAQQKNVFPTRTSSSIVRPDENTAPAAAAQTPESPRGKHRRQIVSPAVVAALSPSRHANAGGVRSAPEAVAPMAPLTSKPSALGPTREPVTARFPARELYEATWRALDDAFAATTTEEIDQLPTPAKLEAPRVFITSWVDYTHKYGTAYSLTDGSSGLYFNDSTTMVLAADKSNFDYISQRKANVFTRKHHSMAAHPAELERKAHLLRFFDDYMAKTLTRNIDQWKEDEPRTRNMHFLVKYYRMKNAIVFKLSNDVLQFNFYDHTKILVTNHGETVTFLDGNFTPTTYSVASLFREGARLGYYRREGAGDDLKRREKLEQVKFMLSKLEYARDVLRTLSQRRSASGKSAEGDKESA